MDLSGLRAWQWMIIGTLAGAAVGFSWSLRSTDLDVRSAGKNEFRYLVQQSDQRGKNAPAPVIRNIVVRDPQLDPQNVLVYPVTYEYQAVGRIGFQRRLAGGKAPALGAKPADIPWTEGGINAETPFFEGKSIKEYLDLAKLPYTDRSGAAKWRPMYWCAGGGFAVIGLLWPGLIQGMILAGLVKAPPPREKKVKTPKHRTGEDVDEMLAQPVAKKVDAGALDALNDAMEASLASTLTSGGPRATTAAAAEEPVSLFAGGGARGAPDPTEAPRPMTPEEKKDYAGDYYPVARTAKKDGESH